MDRPFDSAIRIAMSEAVAEFGLRAMAREVAMSPSGLKKFLDGGEPYTKTRQRLELWYSTWGTAQRTHIRDAALAVLVKTFPEARREAVAQRLREVLLDSGESEDDGRQRSARGNKGNRQH